MLTLLRVSTFATDHILSRSKRIELHDSGCLLCMKNTETTEAKLIDILHKNITENDLLNTSTHRERNVFVIGNSIDTKSAKIRAFLLMLRRINFNVFYSKNERYHDKMKNTIVLTDRYVETPKDTMTMLCINKSLSSSLPSKERNRLDIFTSQFENTLDKITRLFIQKENRVNIEDIVSVMKNEECVCNNETNNKIYVLI